MLHQRALEKWQSAGAFRSFVRSQLRPMSSVDFYARKNKHLLEAWLGMKLLEHMPVIQACRLPQKSERWPDCEVILNGAPVAIEMTEVLMPGRNRLQEYRAAQSSANGLTHLDDEELSKRRSAIPTELSRIIEKKCRKRYPPGAGLAIYLNIGTFDWWREEIEAAIDERIDVANVAFKFVWVLWGDRLYQNRIER